MKKGRDYFLLGIILVYLIVLGFWRDHLFVNLNYQISKLYYKDTFEYALPGDMKWLEQFTYMQLYRGKFILTLLFSLLYLAPTYILIKRFFKDQRFNRITLVTYLILFLASLLIFCIGRYIGMYNTMYSISRYIMGFMQSPLLLMILFLGFSITQPKTGVK